MLLAKDRKWEIREMDDSIGCCLDQTHWQNTRLFHLL
jgi:hypothetical protein